MANNEIKYQINGQLADNTVTVDNKEDMILVPVNVGSANEARIIAEMKAEDSGLRTETLQHVFDLEKRVIKRLLMSGYSVNTGLYHAAVSFRGVIEDSVWNPATNSIVVNFNVGTDLREAIKQTDVSIIGEKGSAMYVAGVQDTATRAKDSSATAGRAFTLTGSQLKVVGNDPSVGITLTNSRGDQYKITNDLFVINEPSKVTFILPSSLPEDTYELTITTQYGGSRLLKTPHSAVKNIFVNESPDDDGDHGEDPTI